MMHYTSTDKEDEDIVKMMNSFDPRRVLYNGLVPFLISMLEYFFSETFQVLIKYDKFAQNKKAEHRQKVEFKNLLEMEKGQRSLESIIADNYTFQNLDQVNRAYREWVNIDIRKVLSKRKKIGRSVAFLERRISELIEYRHGIVHHFMIDTSLSKTDFLALASTTKLCISEVAGYLEGKYSVRIREL